MHLQTAQADVLQLGRARIHARDFLERDSKLVVVGAGGDFLVGLGVHIGVHADGHRRGFLELAGDPVDAFQFRFAFHVKTIDPLAQSEGDFILRLAHAGKDAFTRVASGGNDPLDLTAAHGIKAAAQIRQRAHDAEVGVGFHGETDQVIQWRQRGVQAVEIIRQRLGRVNIQRTAVLLGQRFDGNALAIQAPADIAEMMHARVMPNPRPKVKPKGY